MNTYSFLKKVWHFLWHDDSLLSWLVNILLAFLLVKFLLYPGLGFAFSTTHPVVAVVSSSMDHQGASFETWWEGGNSFYVSEKNMSMGDIRRFKNGFNKGDLIVLFGSDSLQRGDVIVFWGSASDPIIHRIVDVHEDGSYQTKGDNLATNPQSRPDELFIAPRNVIGKAVLRVPYLGWLKVGLVSFLSSF